MKNLQYVRNWREMKKAREMRVVALTPCGRGWRVFAPGEGC
jgi:hypothetical protein